VFVLLIALLLGTRSPKASVTAIIRSDDPLRAGSSISPESRPEGVRVTDSEAPPNVSGYASLAARKDSAIRAHGAGPAQKGERHEGVVVALRPQGFEVTQITRPPGLFPLIVLNRARLDQVVLRIDRDTGQNVKKVIAPKEKPDWVDENDLAPGKY